MNHYSTPIRDPKEAGEYIGSEEGQRKIQEILENVRIDTERLNEARKLDLTRLYKHITI